MNKYKMISICSLTIACVLMLSILLPGTTIANDKESIDLSMHYENSQVTANIVVNSDVYTGIVCKYFVVDDVLKYDDILTQTRENGTTINLDKSEDDKYTAVIPDVNKRYVVVYVSIGNCSLCDYLDCKPNKNIDENNKQETKIDNSNHGMSVTGEGENGQTVVAETKNEQTLQSENKGENNNTVVEEKVEQNVQKNDINAQEVSTEVTQNNEKSKETTSNQNGNESEKIVVNNTVESEKDFQTIEELVTSGAAEKTENVNTTETIQTNQNTQSKESIDITNYNKDDTNVLKTNSSVTNRGQSTSVSTGDKDAIDTTNFEEIEKVISTSTVNGNMPQTGEDDFVKIIGIIVFSAISMISFFKYKKTK